MFENCKNLETVKIGTNVTEIGSSAFGGCSGLTTITWGSNLKTIGYHAFYGCSSLTALSIPDTVTSIGEAAFYDCTALTEVYVGKKVTSISNYAFRYDSSIKKVYLPLSLQSIGYDAFNNCTGLTDVYYTGSSGDWSTVYVGSDNVPLENATFHYNYSSDVTKPIGSISSTNNVATSQTVTLRLSDNMGVAGYYWGTSITYSDNTYTTTNGTTITKTISSAGTYYLVVKDTSGNLSDIYTITFYKTTLNANGGSVSPSYVITKSGNSVTLPLPTKSNATFLGWGTSSTSTSGIKSVTPTSNKTYYAIWEEVPTITLGDINGDGVVDAGDAVLISRYDAGLVTLTSDQLQAGDVNGDGVVDAGDAVIISRYDAGLISSLV